MKRILIITIAALTVLTMSAMIAKLTYVKVSDKGCGNKCVISNADEGMTRICGKCGQGFLIGGRSKYVEGGWQQAEFTCNKCGHPSTWKYKMK